MLTQIEAQGVNIRTLKGSNADAKTVEAEVALLLKMKEEYKTLTGSEVPGGKPSKKKAEGKEKEPAGAAGEAAKPEKAKKGKKADAPEEAKKEEKAEDGKAEVSKVILISLLECL